MKIDIIIVTQNNQAAAERCLNSIRDTLHGGNVRWYIMDDGSTDKTSLWLRDNLARKPGVHLYLRKTMGGVADSLQVLIDRSDGDFIVRLDSNAVATRSDWLGKLLLPLKGSRYGMTGQDGYRANADRTDYEKAIDYIGPVGFVSGPCRAHCRALNLSLDTTLHTNQEQDVALALQVFRAGKRIWCTGDIGIRYSEERQK